VSKNVSMGRPGLEFSLRERIRDNPRDVKGLGKKWKKKSGV